jgi:hypothetical protein
MICYSQRDLEGEDFISAIKNEILSERCRSIAIENNFFS